MSKKASEALLEELHAQIARSLLDKIASGEATAADLNVARAFLKDNGIEGVATSGSPLRSLVDELPDMDIHSRIMTH